MRVKLRVLRQLLLVLIFLLFDVCRTGDKARMVMVFRRRRNDIIKQFISISTTNDSFQAQAKRLGVIGHYPSHAPSA
jgi:hypothetical protein